jgi:hypothetical protein
MQINTNLYKSIQMYPNPFCSSFSHSRFIRCPVVHKPLYRPGGPALPPDVMALAAMAMRWIGAAAHRGWASRAASLQRVAMLIDGDQSGVTCVCVVDGVPAGFQIDCGSTFTQTSSALAPKRMPRRGLGSASCLGCRLEIS